MSLPFAPVRTVTGVPTVANFANMDGTPIVIDDATGNAYTLVAGVVTAICSALFTLVPSGTIFDYGGNTTPSGWLACDGSSVLRTDYPNLFTAIGTTWGSVDGTHFNVPDLRGRSAIGDGTGSGLTARTVGQKGGEETHQLILAEIPSHAHTGGAHTHTSGTLGVQSVSGGAGSTTGLLQQASSQNAGVFSLSGSTASGGNVATTSAGSDGSHNTMMPFGVVRKIIKT